MRSGCVAVGAVDLAFDQFGRDGDPAILLLMGNSAPGLVWPDRFCALLAEARFRVIRFDQRDTGLSSQVDFTRSPYSLHDLVDDAVGLLDRLGLATAHMVGLSQGGVLALLAALRHPARVGHIATIMSSPDLGPKNDAFTGRPEIPGELPRPAPDYVRAVIALNSAAETSDAAVAERFMENFRLAAGGRSPFDEPFWRSLGHAVATRRHGPHAAMANHSNHAKAQMATPPLAADDLARVKQRCLVLHGDMDPIFPLAHAVWAASRLPHAELAVIPDMGHALDPSFFAPVAARLVSFLTEGRAAV
jgi:pimeloyl-ACP methyl ester carboxylesterase